MKPSTRKIYIIWCVRFCYFSSSAFTSIWLPLYFIIYYRIEVAWRWIRFPGDNFIAYNKNKTKLLYNAMQCIFFLLSVLKLFILRPRTISNFDVLEWRAKGWEITDRCTRCECVCCVHWKCHNIDEYIHLSGRTYHPHSARIFCWPNWKYILCQIWHFFLPNWRYVEPLGMRKGLIVLFDLELYVCCLHYICSAHYETTPAPYVNGFDTETIPMYVSVLMGNGDLTYVADVWCVNFGTHSKWNLSRFHV